MGTVIERANMILVTAVMACSQMFIFMRLSEFRFDPKKTKAAAAVLLVVMLGVCTAYCWSHGTYRGTEISLLTLTLPCVIFYFIVSKYRGIRFIVTYCIADLSIACMDFFLYLARVIICGRQHWVADTIIRCVGVLVWAALIIRRVGDRYQKALNILEKGWGIMMVTGISEYVLLVMLSSYPAPIQDRPEDMPVAMMTLVLMEITLVLIVRVIYNTMELKEKSVRETQLDIQVKMAKKQYRLMQENVQQIKGIKHDMKHHFLVISQMLKDNKKEECKDYVDALSGIGDIELHPFGENYTISVLAAFFEEQAKEEDIRFECRIQVPREIHLSPENLTVILGNTWQNALEACRMLPSDRYISTDILYNEGRLIIKCENSLAQELRIRKSENRLLSTKGRHRGLGIENIRRIAREHGGDCFFEQKDSKFIFTVVWQEEKDVSDCGV